MSQWIVLSKVHPDLSARILMEAGITVIEASTEKPEGQNAYPILVDDGDDDSDLEECIDANLKYFAGRTGQKEWESGVCK